MQWKQNFLPLGTFWLADLNNCRIYLFYSKYSQRLCFSYKESSFSRQIHDTFFFHLFAFIFFFVCISSFQLDWTIPETTDLSLCFFPTPFHLAWCVHLTDSVNFNGLISWERWRDEGPSANLGDNWVAEVVTILFNVILSGLRTLSCK